MVYTFDKAHIDELDRGVEKQKQKKLEKEPLLNLLKMNLHFMSSFLTNKPQN